MKTANLPKKIEMQSFYCRKKLSLAFLVGVCSPDETVKMLRSDKRDEYAV